MVKYIFWHSSADDVDRGKQYACNSTSSLDEKKDSLIT
jgi:hypothetical protein